jgi:YhcH/YjgK/YiaL family protein
MILDSLGHSQFYHRLHPKFAEVFEFLRTTHTKPPGEYELDGRSCYVIVTRGNPKKQNESFLETHRRYIDIHFLMEGNERIGWLSIERCSQVDKEYNPEKDFTTYHDAPQLLLELVPGEFTVFFPEDAHAPGICDTAIFKAVAKIAV